MRLPVLVIGGVAAAMAVCVRKVTSGYSDRKEAKRLNEDGAAKFYRAKKRLKRARKKCKKQLKALGQLNLEVWHRQLGRFVTLFQKLRNVDLQGAPEMDELGTGFETGLAEMQDVTRRVAEAFGGGTIAASSGILIGVASYGSATLFATASTGTAISTLSGVAAKSATLAWFGGGSLAAGGLGVAGGTAVLGGITVAPALAVGSTVYANKAREVLAEAKCNHARNKSAAKEMRNAAKEVKGITKEAVQLCELLVRLDECSSEVLDAFEALLDRNGSDYAEYAKSERQIVYRAVGFARGLKKVLETPLLDESGVSANGYQKALDHGSGLLAQTEEP